MIGPADLPAIKPDAVLVANGIYRDEVAGEIARVGVGAPLHTLVGAPRTLTP